MPVLVVIRWVHLLAWMMVVGVGLAVGLTRRSSEEGLILAAGTDALVIDFPSGIVRDVENPFVSMYNPSQDRVIRSPDGQHQFRVVYAPAGNSVSNVYSLYHDLPDEQRVPILENINRNTQWFSSDSRYLYFYAQRQSARQVWRYDIAAQTAERVLGRVQMDCRGDRCALMETRDGPPDNRSNYFLYYMNLRDGEPIRIAEARRTNAGIPYKFSWEADQLAYTLPTGDGGHTVHVYDIASGQSSQLAEVPGVQFIRRLDWKPEGTWLSLTTTTRENRIDVIAVSADPAAPQAINFTGGVPGETFQVYPFWSDDEPLIVFTYQDNRERNLYIGSLEDGSLRRLTDFEDVAHMQAWWSPGSRWVAVAVQVQNFPNYTCELVIYHRATRQPVYRLDFSDNSGLCERAFGVRWQ